MWQECGKCRIWSFHGSWATQLPFSVGFQGAPSVSSHKSSSAAASREVRKLVKNASSQVAIYMYTHLRSLLRRSLVRFAKLAVSSRRFSRCLLGWRTPPPCLSASRNRIEPSLESSSRSPGQ